jgi:hypothetical protein
MSLKFKEIAVFLLKTLIKFTFFLVGGLQHALQEQNAQDILDRSSKLSCSNRSRTFLIKDKTLEEAWG